MGVEWLVCRDLFATAKASVDWVLFENTAALEAYRANVKEQIACGHPPTPLTYQRAVTVAATGTIPIPEAAIYHARRAFVDTTGVMLAEAS